MSEFTGKDAYLEWVWSGGTITMHSDFRTYSWTPSKALHDVTAGSDVAQQNITGIQNATASVGLLAQAGGTVLIAALAYGNKGTLTMGVEGTVSGKPKVTLPAMALGAKMSPSYDAAVEISCDFQQDTGAYTEGSW
jgi:hypothetical protein